ncbi:MAG: HAD hydrolase-like protein [Bacteroidota bacterium]
MPELTDFKVVLWDFDGVILDSMPIRELGFRKVLEEYSEDKVELLITYHNKNGGLSRYNKFDYFFRNILETAIDDKRIQELARNFSTEMKKLLTDKSLLIKDSLSYIKSYFSTQEFHIVSGSDNFELNFLAKELEINQYFRSINGSPTPKKQIVNKLIINNTWGLDEVCLIGDSFNDLEAAHNNGITFIGYNNLQLRNRSNVKYIDSF